MAVERWQHAIRLLDDPGLRNELFQIESRVIQAKFGADIGTRWNYRVLRIVRNITAIQEGFLRLAATSQAPMTPEAQRAARTVAQAWENIAQLGEGIPRATALLNAAVAYDFAGYQANSACLAQLALQDDEWTKEPSLDSVVSAFLQRRFLRLNLLSEELARPPDPSVSITTDELQRRAAQAVLARSLSAAAFYFLSGSIKALDKADSYLDLAARSATNLGDVVLTTTSLDLRNLLPVVKRRSTWTLLGHISSSPRWRRYIRVLARGLGKDVLDGRSICELWPSQKEALEQGLLTSDDNLVIRMPTSAGKTRIAEMLMVHTLISRPGAKCVYVAPYRALVNEIDDAFGMLFSDIGYGANAIHGAYDQDEYGQLIVSTEDILVLTPEKLDLLFRLQPELLDAVALVVIDEGHIVGDADRGSKFELLISRLRRRLPTARFIMMSAVVPEQTLDDFAQWIGGGKAARITSTWRPAVLKVAKLEWSGKVGTLRYVERGKSELFVPSVISQKMFEHYFQETGRIRRPRFPASNKGEVAAELAYVYANQGPVLVFTMQTNWAESIALKVMRRLELTELGGQGLHSVFRHRRNSRASAVSSEWLGPDHQLSELLDRGVAYHHARLPTPVRESIEEDFRNGQLAVLVATSTLAQGVNLPVRTVVFHSTRSQDADGNSRQLTARDYWNIAGRAGRAGHETTGTAIHIVMNRMDNQDFQRYVQQQDQVEPVESALYRLLDDLLSRRISSDEAASKLDADLLALLVEEDESILQKDLLGILSTSLFNIQAMGTQTPVQALTDVMTNSVLNIISNVPTAEKRRLYASTGLSSSSCLLVSAHITEQAVRVRGILESTSNSVEPELLEVLMDVLSQLWEMAPRELLSGYEAIVLAQWIEGLPIPDIASAAKIDPQELTRYIEDVYSYRMPWGTSAYLRIADFELPDLEVSLVAANVAGILKYGVPTPEAVWAMTAGVASRKASIMLGTRFVSEGKPRTPFEFKKWLGRFNPDSLSDELGLQGTELEMTARAVLRSQSNAFLRALDTQDDILPLETSVRAKPAAFTTGMAQRIRQGSSLQLKRDLDSRLNRNAVIAVYEGVNVGYLPTDAAQAVALEIDVGRSVVATALTETDSSQTIRLLLSET